MEKPPSAARMTTSTSAVAPSICTGPFEMLSGRVLIVEDDVLNQHLIRRMLEKHGLQSTMADTGESAVELAVRETWGVVLMDCQLPDIDGFEATRRIRARLNGRPLPIVALTASVTPEDRADCAAAGMDDFLAKPVRRAELHACLKKWLGHAPARTDSPHPSA
jgi:CheY-like chemotaxis protein